MKLYLRKRSGQPFVKVVTDGNEDVKLNFTHDNLENPTNYVSEYSYQINVPRCQENNKLFDEFVRLDSVVLSEGYNPTKRMDYVILGDTGEIISTGYGYIKSVTKKTYNLSLVGSLSKIFNQLLNSGWNENALEDDSTYFLMTDWLKKTITPDGVMVSGNNYITRNLVYASWLIDTPAFSVFLQNNMRYKILYGLSGDTHVSETNAFIATMVGFAPTAQGKYKDFDSKNWVESGTVVYLGEPHDAAPSLLPVLCSERDSKGEPIQAVEVEDGCIEPQIGEYRSYYQQPFIYVSALWTLYRLQFKDITGYDLVLDGRWFDDSNDELNKLVYMLPQLKIDEKILVDNIQIPVRTGGIGNSFLLPEVYKRSTDYPPVETISGLSIKVTLNSDVVHCEGGKRLTADISFTVRIEDFAYSTNPDDAGHRYYFSGFNPFEMKINVIDSQNNVVATKKCLIYPIPTDGAITLDSMKNDTYINDILISNCYVNDYELVTCSYIPWGMSGDHRMLINTNIGADIEDEGDYHIGISFGYNRSVAPFVIKGGESDVYFFKGYDYTGSIHIPSIMKYNVKITGSISEGMRSNSIVTLGRLFGDIKPFNVLLQYCKEHHLLWIVDDFTKEVTVKRATDYYSDISSPVDITDVISFDKIEVTPLSWDSRKIFFNMGEMGCSYVDGYKDRWGRDYGSKEIITRNEISKEEKNLLNGDIRASSMLSQTVVPIDALRNAMIYAAAMEIVPMPLNVNDGEQANCYSNFYYRHDNSVWQDEILDKWRRDNNGAFVIVTDDHPVEVVSGEYCWRGPGIEDVLSIKCYERPVFRTVSDGGLSVLFAPVREVYTATPDEASQYLYERCWKNYVEEAYNQQNKTLEVYLDISLPMLRKLRKNALVKLENVIYLLMEIKAWGEHSTVCKCKLRQITDINKLTQ